MSEEKQNVVEKAVETVKETAEKVVEKTVDVAKDTVDAVKETTEDVVDAVKAPARSKKATWWNRIWSAIVGAVLAVAAMFGITIGSVAAEIYNKDIARLIEWCKKHNIK